MRRSAPALLAMITLGTVLGGCSGFQPFWQSSTNQGAADHVAANASKETKTSFFGGGKSEQAERSIEGPLTLARLAEQRGKTLEAERLYKSILEKSPDNPVIYHRLAIMQSRKGHFEEANAYFDQALRLKSDDPTLICDAGYCQYLQNRLDLAETLFRQALEIDPMHEASTNNLALVLAEQGDDQTAFSLFRQTGTEAKAHANMGFIYSRRGDLQKAKAAYSRALSIDPQMIAAAEAMVQLARFERQAKASVAQSRASANAWAEHEASGGHQPDTRASEVAAFPDQAMPRPDARQPAALPAAEPAAGWAFVIPEDPATVEFASADDQEPLVEPTGYSASASDDSPAAPYPPQGN